MQSRSTKKQTGKSQKGRSVQGRGDVVRKPRVNPPYVILVGSNGTGKSTKMRALMPAQNRNLILPSNMDDSSDTWGDVTQVLKPEFKWVKEERPPGQKERYIKVWHFPGIKTFKGTAKIHLDDIPANEPKLTPVDLFRAVLRDYKNGGLFMDDCKNYIYSQGNLPAWINGVFRNRRHKNISIYLAIHHYKDLNGDLLSFSPVIAMCRVGHLPNKSFLDKVPDPDHFLKVVKQVQDQSNPSKTNHDPYFCAMYRVDTQ